MTREAIRRQADRLRAVPLKAVLQLRGIRPDRYDSFKWHTSRGSLSVRGAKFIHWNSGLGGGGAIDLVMHLDQCGFGQALDWLQRHFPCVSWLEEDRPPSPSPLKLPPPDPAQLGRVIDYLLRERALSPALIEPLIDSGTLYADSRANAVFLLRAPDATVVGAELRGTTARPWRGMAPGSRKNLGSFSVPESTSAQDPRPLILCESAIDALSCLALHPDHRCLSTAGARPNPSWLSPLIDQGLPIHCGFDADDTGERMAQAMIALHPSVQRLRPARGDWNDQLKFRA